MNDHTAPSGYLETFLAPLEPFLRRPDVTDLFVNRPGEVWIESIRGQQERAEVPELDDAALWRLARQIASLTHQGVSRERPLLSARLPDGARVQIVAPPATRGPMAMAIRKHVISRRRLADYADDGALSETHVGAAFRERPAITMPSHPRGLVEALAEAVRARRNILISGGAATGKTTLLNALLGEVPPQERLVLIEDTPEIQASHANLVGLVAVKGELGEAQVTTDDLLQAALRLRPDRIVLGELRGAEAYSFLRAVNTGHPGSITTLHADSPLGAIEQLALIILQSGSRLGREDVLAYVRHTVDIFVQLARRDGRRVVSEIVLRGGI